MKNIKTADYFKVNHIYNFCYFGDNEAYKAKNGQTTRKITKIEKGEVQLTTLFARYPKDVQSPFLESTSYWRMEALLESQREYSIEEATEDKWFRHSHRMTVNEAVAQGLILKNTIEHVFRDQSQDWIRTNPVSCHVRDIGRPYYSLQLGCQENVSPNPYLQRIVMVWESKEEMKADVRSVFPGAWFG